VQRVVLVDFPHADMRAIGFVMNTFKEESTGRDLVPCSCRPHQSHLRLFGNLAADKTIFVDMTFDQAMAMVVSGGAIGPEKLTLPPSRRRGPAGRLAAATPAAAAGQ